VPAVTHEVPRLQPLLFSQFDAARSNYLLWTKTAKGDIFVENLSESIVFDRDFVVSTIIFPSLSRKSLFLLRHHLDPSLQHQYLELDKPTKLWQKLKSRFNHQKTIFLPNARQEWTYL